MGKWDLPGGNKLTSVMSRFNHLRRKRREAVEAMEAAPPKTPEREKWAEEIRQIDIGLVELEGERLRGKGFTDTFRIPASKTARD